MGVPDLLTETDFFRREFPMPANPYRPLAVVAPRPDEDGAAVAAAVRDAAANGYGGLVLDPALFGSAFLGSAWFDLVGLYLEACRLTGQFVWVMDGLATGAAAAIKDLMEPGRRREEIASRSTVVSGSSRLDLTLAGPARGRLLGLMALPLEGGGPPVNLQARVSGEYTLSWDPPPGRWQILSFWAAPRSAAPTAALDWLDPAAVEAWLRAAYIPYRERYGSHFGRTLQGFFAACPSWPRMNRASREGSWPLLSDPEPDWHDLAALAGAAGPAPPHQAYALRLTAAARRSYVEPLRAWCWRHRLRIAGYRLGGIPLAGLLEGFDLGGQPDLMAEAAPDPAEVAFMAALARHHRQEKVACLLRLSGEIAADRAAIGGLAAAGGNFFIFRRSPQTSPGCEPALADYAARLCMAVSAGSPAAEINLEPPSEPEALAPAGARALELARRGLEAVYPPSPPAGPAGLAAVAGPAAAGAGEEAAGLDGSDLPPHLFLRARRVEAWTVHTYINQSNGEWRGLVPLPNPGSAEIWDLSTGGQRDLPAIGKEGRPRALLALAPGEAAVAVLRRARLSRQAHSQVVKAHITLGRSWRFEAAGGNVLPLAWRENGRGGWLAAFEALVIPSDLRLRRRPASAFVLLNGTPLETDEEIPISALSRQGYNSLEIVGAGETPAAELQGGFACRGGALAAAPAELAGPWTQNGYPFFAGPGIYRQNLHVPPELARPDLSAWLEIAALADSAQVRINGALAGCLPWPPYRLDLGPADRFAPGINELEIEVHAPANRPSWAFKGLLGEVSILFGDTDAESGQAFPGFPDLTAAG
ncbi:MAG: hypothetical protein ACM3X6_08395 [Patescibacteria group bacterium]